MLELFGQQITPAMAWLAAGLALLLLEVTTGTLWMLWPGLAALVFAIVAALFPELAAPVQLILFAATAAALTVLGQRYLKSRVGGRASDRPELNDRAAQLIGRHVTLIGRFENGYGAVRLDDGQWNARLQTGDGHDVAPGAHLKIIAVEGVSLVVAPI